VDKRLALGTNAKHLPGDQAPPHSKTYLRDRLTMGFIVQSVSRRAGAPPYRTTRATKQDALDAAIGFLAQGMEGVTIIDEKGQVYTTSEFVDFMEEPPAT
jgi:hypothetical protein